MIDKKGLKPDFKWDSKGLSSYPRKDMENDALLNWALEVVAKNSK